jgi:hypothetical protein
LLVFAAGSDPSLPLAFVETEFHGPADQEFIEEEKLGEPEDPRQRKRIPPSGLWQERRFEAAQRESG